MRKLLIPLFIIITLSACQESQPETFEREGIIITSPQGWKITEQENLDDQGFYLVIEKDGFNSSGLISFTWLNEVQDLDEWIGRHQDGMMSNLIYKNADLSFSNMVQDEFNSIPTKSVSYTASIIGIEHEGTLHVFHQGGKTFSILKQEAVEDHETNKEGFDFIENSLTIKSN